MPIIDERRNPPLRIRSVLYALSASPSRKCSKKYRSSIADNWAFYPNSPDTKSVILKFNLKITLNIDGITAQESRWRNMIEDRFER